MLTWRNFIVQRPHAWDSLGETLRISGHALLEVKQHADMASDVSWWRGNLIMFYWCVRWHGDDEVGDPPAWHTVIQMMCLTDGPFWLTIMVWPVQSNWVIGSVDSYVLAFVLSLCAYDIIWTCVMLPRSNAICEKKSVTFLARPWHVPRFLRWFLVQYFS